MYISIVYKIHK